MDTKPQKTKPRKLQNREITKPRMLQNRECYKTANVTKPRNYITGNVTKQRLLQKYNYVGFFLNLLFKQRENKLYIKSMNNLCIQKQKNK